MIQAKSAGFICSQCARQLPKVKRPGVIASSHVQFRHASRLGRRTTKGPPPQRLAAQQPLPTAEQAGQRAKQEYAGPPPRQPSYDWKDDTPADRPWATTFTNTVWIVSGTVFSLLLGLYGTQYYISATQPAPDTSNAPPINLTAVYDEYAPHFDQDVDRTEYWNGIMTLRSRLVKQARGHVLESAAGTGRNAEYYLSGRVKTLTVVDKSSGMLGVAEKKWPHDRGEGEDWNGRIRFVVGDIEDASTRAHLSQQFDTVVQTLGLCSTDDPDALMRALTGLVKPGGKILLLEHGQSYFDGLNRMLDRSAREHAAKHGCWWNRDIGAIVEKSGMEIVEMKRTWRSAGTNWYVVLRKPQGEQKEASSSR